jgi:hypothetical protein
MDRHTVHHRVDRVLGYFSSRQKWHFSTPSPTGECVPPSFGSGREVHTRLRERAWGGPNSDEGTDPVVL